MDIRAFIKAVLNENFILEEECNGELFQENLLTEYDFEPFIRKNNIGPGLSIKFKNDPILYYIKSIAPNRKNIFVTDSTGSRIFSKYLGNTVSVAGRTITLNEFVRKRGSEYVVLSKKGKVLGKGYHSKKAAQKRLGQIEYFKSLGEEEIEEIKRQPITSDPYEYLYQTRPELKKTPEFLYKGIRLLHAYGIKNHGKISPSPTSKLPLYFTDNLSHAQYAALNKDNGVIIRTRFENDFKSSETLNNAWFVRHSIPISKLEIFINKEWIPLEKYDIILKEENVDIVHKAIIGKAIDGNDVSEIGANYFGTFVKNLNTYKTSRKGGYHKEGVVKGEITRRKIKQVVEFLQKKGAEIISGSYTTNSYYLSIKNTQIRISDHIKNNFNGIDILIQWNSNLNEMLHLTLFAIENI